MKKGISATVFIIIAFIIGILLVVLFMGASGWQLGTLMGTSKKEICYQKFLNEYCKPWKDIYYSIQNKPTLLEEKKKDLANPGSDCYHYFNNTFAGTKDFIIDITNDELTRQKCKEVLGGEIKE
jgi:hypothetical protein